jgi:hypothetical protein
VRRTHALSKQLRSEMTHMQLPDDNALDLDSRNHSCSGAGGNRVMRVCNKKQKSKMVNIEGPVKTV